jgi:tRNA pseudouridine55 synthase
MVLAVRRVLGGRVGHAGTLDPFASGLLVMLLGSATRLSQVFLTLPKEYEMTVQFGSVSSTGDPTGDITAMGPAVAKETVLRALDGLTGRVRQKVPLTSAVKIQGERLYKKAHRGETVETPEREVSIYDATLVSFDEAAQTARVIVLCGSGTYLRVLAQDLGSATGAGAYATALRRTRVGCFHVGQAVTTTVAFAGRVEDLAKGLRGLEKAVAWIPRLSLEGDQVRLVSHGNEISVGSEGRFRVYDGERLVGVYAAQAGVARPLLVIPGGD